MSKNYKGGYKIIDIQGGNTQVKGIYHAVESSYSKALLLSGIVINGVEKNDVPVTSYEIVNGVYTFKHIYGYTITIEEDDNVEVLKDEDSQIEVTTDEEEYNVTINDDEEYLLKSTRENGTTFSFDDNLRLILSFLSDETNFIDGWGTGGEGLSCYIMLKKNIKCSIKRVGTMILATILHEN